MTTQGKKKGFLIKFQYYITIFQVNILINTMIYQLKKKKKSQGLKMRKYNESSAENKIKNETEQLLLKYKHGNNIHEYGKQQNEQAT